jgi:glycosyltransferase involved in cell wall biosynthesis
LIPLGDEVALYEGICQLLENNARRRQMGQEARAWVESEFSMARLVDKTTRVYEDALDSLTVVAGDRDRK